MNNSEVFTKAERDEMIRRMRVVSTQFYSQAVLIGNHPFIEFCGLMNEYINNCQRANDQGIDFTQCNTHTGIDLPIPQFSINYINEKLECIFTGRSVMNSNE